MDISNLQGLSPKTANLLRRYGHMTTVEELQCLKPEDLLKIQRIGVASVEEIKNALKSVQINDGDTLSEELFEEPKATELEKLREEKRQKQEITYDCFNAVYPRQGRRVLCRVGHKINPLAKDGGIDLISVLAGRSGSTCRKCKDRARD